MVAKGVQEANERLDDEEDTKRWPRVEHLTLIELYLDRAIEAWRALTLQAASSPASYVVTGAVQTGSGGLRRLLDAAYRGAPYDFISVTSGEAGPGESRITYALDTTRARTEINGHSTQSRLIQNLVLNASNAENADPLIGKTLFKLLVPPEIEAFLGGTTEMQIELDRGTAGIPWELLDTEIPGNSDSRPWAIRTKLLRKLRTASYRSHVVDASAESGVLIIGEPQCDAKRYPDLPAARREAAAVAATFANRPIAEAGFTSTVRTLIRPDSVDTPGPDARTILNAVMSRDWRIVHISGHGEPPELIGPIPKTAADPPQTHGAPRGVVLSDDLFLGPHELKSMRVVPELVFVNCCFLAQRGMGQLLDPGEWRYQPYNRAQFASTVADALIDIGVRCVIAAGWAVEDGPASVFAETFYEALVAGSRFLDAVAVAREAAQKMGGNTWAAYQCYGDPEWTFRPATGDAQRPGKAYGDEFAAIASAESLMLALHTIGVNSEFNRAGEAEQVDRLRYLETRFRATWGALGNVAAAFGRAWSALGKRAPAIEWLQQARAAQDGTTPLHALEELANLQVRDAWETVERAAPGRARKAALAAARKRIAEARTLLDTLLALGSTVERENLYGSAFKRLAMIEAEAGDAAAERNAIEGMKRHYGKAEDIAKETKAAELYYPAMNRMAAELALLDRRRRGVTRGLENLPAVRESLSAAPPGFWSIVGQTELSMYEALSAGTLRTNLPALTEQFQAHHDRVPRALKSWASVYDNATFVLQKYQTHAPAPEGAAAGQLLRLLKSFAAPP